jgi:two-component system, response regulator / RNA-binding antiterminator
MIFRYRAGTSSGRAVQVRQDGRLKTVWLAYCWNRPECVETRLKRILIIDDVRDRAAWLKASLELAGFDVAGLLTWEQVDEDSIGAASADVIIVDANAPGRDTLEQISLMSITLEKPVVVLGAQKDQRSIQEAMRAGVSAYVAHTVQGEDLSGIIHVAAARFAEYKRLRDELKEAKSQLAERKLVDRAKGILMADHGYSEPEAYKRMRSMAMSKGKRLAEIAEAIILAKELSS